MNDCLFCKIIKKEIPSKIVYEDENILAFLDINPVTNGHTLIVPKKHYKNIFEVDKELLNHFEDIEKEIYEVYKEKLNSTGLTLLTNVDDAQEIKHFHVHLIPRYQNDEVKLLSNTNILKEIDDIEDIIKD